MRYHHYNGVGATQVAAINLDVKNFKRVAIRVPGFDNYRARDHSGLGQTWLAPTTARLWAQRLDPGILSHLQMKGHVMVGLQPPLLVARGDGGLALRKVIGPPIGARRSQRSNC